MEVRVNNDIIAVIVLRQSRERVLGGGAPTFVVENEEEQDELGMLLARITQGMVHDLKNGIFILVRH